MRENFAGQWLYLRTIEGSTPDVYLFPNFGENLRRDFRRETELFFQSILRENRSVLDLITADYTFVNERLARHYGIPNVYGSHFRRVTIPDENRRGLLGQGSILTVTSLADRTTVVGRGKWILENLLGAPPPPPPPNVPPLDENTKGAATPCRCVSAWSSIGRIRSAPAAMRGWIRSASRSRTSTPPAQWRQHESGRADRQRRRCCPTARSSRDRLACASMLLSDPESIVTAVTEKLLMYSLGRGLESYDAPAVRKIVRGAAASNYSMQALVVGIVKSMPFQMRKTEAGNVLAASEKRRSRFNSGGRAIEKEDSKRGADRCSLRRWRFPDERSCAASARACRCPCSMRWCRPCRRWLRRRPRRSIALGFIYTPNGATMAAWTPTGDGPKLDALSPTLSPLEPFRDQLLVPTGLSQRQAESMGDGNGEHSRGQTVWLSGVHPKRTEGADVEAASPSTRSPPRQSGRTCRCSRSRWRSSRTTWSGNCDNGYSCVYWNTISWRTPTTPLPMEVNPRVVFERLFGDGGTPEQRPQAGA